MYLRYKKKFSKVIKMKEDWTIERGGGRKFKKKSLINNISTDAKFFIYNTCLMLNFFSKNWLIFYFIWCFVSSRHSVTPKQTQNACQRLLEICWALVRVWWGSAFKKKSSALTLLSVYSGWALWAGFKNWRVGQPLFFLLSPLSLPMVYFKYTFRNI